MLCHQSLRILLLFLCIHLCNGGHSLCLQPERDALILFKDGLDDASNRLASWTATENECCSWYGVGCDNTTGHVVRLNLRNPDPSVTGQALSAHHLNPTLLALSHLTHLDLSWNSFRSASIPEFIGFFKDLRYLDLSNAGFAGSIPTQLGNLTALTTLHLSNNVVAPLLFVTDATWLTGLTSLEVLDMSYVSFERVLDWQQALTRLPSLLEVRLSNCLLRSSLQLNLQSNLTSLTLLDLSLNDVVGSIPGWIFQQTGLEHLDLRNNQLSGAIPPSIGNLTSLRFLDLSGTQHYFHDGLPETMGNLCNLQLLQLSKSRIETSVTRLGEAFSGCIKDNLEELDLTTIGLTGDLANWLWDFKNLKRLDLSSNSLHGSILIPANMKQSSLQQLNLAGNNLNGTISGGLEKLVELVDLDLSYNSLKGVLSESNFTGLARLQRLDLTQNSLQLAFNSKWIPPFQLRTLHLGFCHLGPRFPTWLRTQQNFYYLDLSNSRISDTLPDWFWNLTLNASHIDLSHNEISGKLPLSFGDNSSTGSFYIDLSFNRFRGLLPRFPSNAEVIDLSNNLLSGPIPVIPNNSEEMTGLVSLSLSMNSISGSIPLYLCRSKGLGVLDLSQNYLSGEIPDCWNTTSVLRNLDLSDNNLSGRIPDTIGSLLLLTSLSLGNNNLSGELTASLRNCRQMLTLDLGSNKLTGNIPTWLGESLPKLIVLVLRSNKFVGTIPPQLSDLKFLKVLDLSKNNITGTIPRSFCNFSAMLAAPKPGREGVGSYYKDDISLVIKGKELEFGVLLASLPITMDLSGNSLTGSIPEEIVMKLLGLQSLNLSANFLTGEITTNIGGLERLESLDLSVNRLSGVIPPSLSELNFLTRLNLSYNNLSGKIPHGNQLQTLDDPTIYIGNQNLCGHPLDRNCTTSEAPNVSETAYTDEDDDDDDGDETEWLYIAIGLGFASGLWIVYGILVLKERPRNVCFRFADDVFDGLCYVGGNWPWVAGLLLFLSVFVCLTALWNWFWR